MMQRKKIAEIQPFYSEACPGTGGRPVRGNQNGRFNLSRFLAIYGSLGVCGMSARAAGPGRNLSTGYPQQRL